MNAISPGAIDTEGLCELFGSSQAGQDRLKAISSTLPLGRLGRPEEIAGAAVFPASDDSRYATRTDSSWTLASRKSRHAQNVAPLRVSA